MVRFDEVLGILSFTGDEDATTVAARRRPLSSALRATRDVIVDLSELRCADPLLMIDLAVLAQRLRKGGRMLRLHGARPQVRFLIEQMGLDRQPAVRLELLP